MVRRTTQEPEENREPGSGSKRRKAYTPRREERSGTSPRTSDKPTAKRRRRYRPGGRALMEIRHLQKTTHLLIRKMPFVRVVREIANNCSTGHGELRWQVPALECMQEESLRHSRETCHDNAQRHPPGSTNPWQI